MKKTIIFIGVLLLLLGLSTFACVSTANLTPEQQREEAIAYTIRTNRLDISMADKNVPIAEQCFIYCDPGYSIKDKIVSSYSRINTLPVIPTDTQRIWARYELANRGAEMEITFTSQPASILSIMGGQGNLEAPRLEAGQSYWLLDPLWVDGSGQNFMVIRLDEAGIRSYTENMWARPSGNLFPYPNRDKWESYEQYHESIVTMWEIRKEATRRQLSSLK